MCMMSNKQKRHVKYMLWLITFPKLIFRRPHSHVKHLFIYQGGMAKKTWSGARVDQWKILVVSMNLWERKSVLSRTLLIICNPVKCLLVWKKGQGWKGREANKVLERIVNNVQEAWEIFFIEVSARKFFCSEK